MSAIERKSLIPVKETIIVPYNNGAVYSTGNSIILLFGAGDAQNWLVQDSFFQFDYKIALTGTKANENYYIRDLSMIFDWVEVVYQGKQVYIQNFNQQAKFIDWVRQGGPYLDYQIYSKTTSKNLPFTRLKVTAGNATSQSNTVTGCIIRVGDLFDIFEKVVEFPLALLDNQIQLTFHLADPRTYLLSAEANGSVNGLYNFKPMSSTMQVDSFSLDRFEFHLKDKVELAASFSPSKTYKFDYTMNQIALRGITGTDFPAASSLNIPFNIVTENVSTMGIYFYSGNSPVASIRPELINVNFKYGNNTSPFSPINVDNYNHAGIYKEFCDDSFDISTSFYGTTNFDYDMSYLPLAAGETSVGKEDSHIVLVTDFVCSGDMLGSPSRLWNSQYIFQANASGKSMSDCTACMWVESKYIAFVKDGKLDSVNI